MCGCVCIYDVLLSMTDVDRYVCGKGYSICVGLCGFTMCLRV